MDNIIIHKNNNIVKIFIYNLQNKEDIKKLNNNLLNDKDTIYEIIIYNLQVIPLDIIIKLQSIKTLIKKLIVNEPKLKHYLQSLNFTVRYEPKEKILNANKLSNIKYIGIGGSAGSIKKVIEFIKMLKPSNLTFFIVLHHKNDDESKTLADIFQYVTKHYKVVEAQSNQKIEEGTIYVAPPKHHMIIGGEYIFLTDDIPNHFSKPSISTTFESLSTSFQDKLLTILVCGYGKDGSDSLEKIKRNGGIVIIEQLYECEATPMLENAIATNQYDYILSIDDMITLLNDKITKVKDFAPYLNNFLEEIYKEYGYDYRNYNKKHILRRIEYFYDTLNLDSFIDFQYKILHDKELFKNLFLNISVNISAFFRNPDMYTKLKDEINQRFKNRKSIKIWCAGCSTGEEAYSIAILLDDLGLLEKSLIYATDLNDVALSYAKNGVYSEKTYKLSYDQYIQFDNIKNFNRYFDNYDDFIVVKQFLKEKVLFFKHNLVTDSVLNEFQVILCRNVIIYFDETLVKRVFDLFDNSLESKGLLVLGESEALRGKSNFIHLNNNIYLKDGI